MTNHMKAVIKTEKRDFLGMQFKAHNISVKSSQRNPLIPSITIYHFNLTSNTETLLLRVSCVWASVWLQRVD